MAILGTVTSTSINKTQPLLLRSWLGVGYGKNHAYLKQSESGYEASSV